MRALRISLYFLPLLLILGASHFLRSLTHQGSVDEQSLTFAISSVPVGIHPFTEQDAISEEVEGLLFDTLIGRSAQMIREGHIAESWSFSSNIRFFFLSDKDAKKGWAELEQNKERWKDWGIIEAELMGDEVRARLKDALPGIPDEIIKIFSPELLSPVTVWNIHTRHSAEESFKRFESGAMETWQVRQIWSRGDQFCEVLSAGKNANFERELKLFYDSNPQLKPDGRQSIVERRGDQKYIFEPRMTLNLRPGIQFHDGHVLTVQDVLYSVELAEKSQSQPMVASALRNIRRMESKGPLSLEITYRHLVATPLDIWEHLSILPAHAWHSYNPNRPDVPMTGTGPFTIRRWVPDEPIVLERNDQYFRGKPGNRQIVYQRVLDDRVRRMQLQTNAVDSYEAKPATFVYLQNRPDFQLIKSRPIRHHFVAWNLDNPILSEQEVRKALAHATNSQALIESLLSGNGQPVNRLFHPSSEIGQAAIEPIPFDLDKARSLLNEAGWSEIRNGYRFRRKIPLKFRLMLSSSEELLGRELQQQWKQAGVQLDLHFASMGKLSGIRSGNTQFDAVLLNRQLPHLRDRFAFWHSSEIGQGRGNFTRLRDEEVDDLLESIRTTFDEEQSLRFTEQLQTRLHQLQPFANLYLSGSARVFHRGEAYVVDQTTRGDVFPRDIGSNKVSLTHDLAWWVKAEHDPIPTPVSASRNTP